MNKTFELFTNEAREKFTAAFATQEFSDFIAKTKAATDSGTFRVIISTAAPDRQGDSVDQNLWDLNNYLNNPVVLWAHDYYSLPIGVATKIEKQNVAGADVLVAEGKFAPADANPFAQQVRALYDAGIVRATSVGFIPNSARMDGKSDQGHELLEFSFVPVFGIPRPLRRNRCPGWLPAGIFNFAEPSIVGTATSPPRASRQGGSSASYFRSAPSTWKSGCGARRTFK